jgi:hypothetical protein
MWAGARTPWPLSWEMRMSKWPDPARRRNSALYAATSLRELLLLWQIQSGERTSTTCSASCHVFQSSFTTNALAMAFSEGERNVGLLITNDLITASPDNYLLMLKEAGNVRPQPEPAEPAPTPSPTPTPSSDPPSTPNPVDPNAPPSEPPKSPLTQEPPPAPEPFAADKLTLPEGMEKNEVYEEFTNFAKEAGFKHSDAQKALDLAAKAIKANSRLAMPHGISSRTSGLTLSRKIQSWVRTWRLTPRHLQRWLTTESLLTRISVRPSISPGPGLTLRLSEL